jgi:hypothetical protein
MISSGLQHTSLTEGAVRQHAVARAVRRRGSSLEVGLQLHGGLEVGVHSNLTETTHHKEEEEEEEEEVVVVEVVVVVVEEVKLIRTTTLQRSLTGLSPSLSLYLSLTLPKLEAMTSAGSPLSS